MAKRTMVLIAVLGVCMFQVLTVRAAEQPTPPPPDGQQPPAGERPERGPRGEGGGFDMEGMQQRMMERMKEQLSPSEDEWKVIEPRLSKVMTLSRQSMGRFMGMGGRRGGFGGPERSRENEQDNPVQSAQETLQQTLEDQNASAAVIKSQLTALRAAREKARQELAQAQQSLREVLTVRQEAQLVMMGLLE